MTVTTALIAGFLVGFAVGVVGTIVAFARAFK